MSPEEFERHLASALLSPDPYAGIRALCSDNSISRELREALGHASEDGVQMSALLIARLRFERLVAGSSTARQMFQHDEQGFSDLFREYHYEVEPTAFFPREEAHLFEQWWAKRSD